MPHEDVNSIWGLFKLHVTNALIIIIIIIINDNN